MRPVPSQIPAADRPLAGCTVLLVDDDPDQQRLIFALLERVGARVVVESNGRTAIDRVLTQSPESGFDAIIMDLLMPVLDGAAATATLRAAGCHTPIIALTAVHEAEIDDLCRSAGFSTLLRKPVTRSTLVQVIGSLWRNPSNAHDQIVTAH